MRVKVHPHRNKVNAGIEACVSVTPEGGKAYYVGYIFLRDARFLIHRSGVERAQTEQVRNVHAWCVGENAFEAHTQFPDFDPTRQGFEQVTYHFNIGRFVTMDGEDVTDIPLRAAICNGRNFYVRRG